MLLNKCHWVSIVMASAAFAGNFGSAANAAVRHGHNFNYNHGAYKKSGASSLTIAIPRGHYRVKHHHFRWGSRPVKYPVPVQNGQPPAEQPVQHLAIIDTPLPEQKTGFGSSGDGPPPGVKVQPLGSVTNPPPYIPPYQGPNEGPHGNIPHPPTNITPPSQPGAAGAVPEPAQWMMLLAGFGLTGGLLRRKNGKRIGSVQQAAA